MKDKLIIAGIVIALLGVVGVWYSSRSSLPPFGSAGGMLIENYVPYVQYNGGINTAKSFNSTGDFTLGSSGSTMTQIIRGTGNLTAPCILIGPGSSIAASSTAVLDCAVTGVQAGDAVFVMPATTTKTGSQFGWSVIGASASSTSGFVTVVLSNNTGAAATPPSTATSTSVLIIR